MSRKRSASPEQDAELPPTKRPHISESESDGELESRAPRPRIDPTYGQRGAFPGLDEPENDNDLFYGPAADGLEYLRMVRSEAKTVPNLLVAKSTPANRTEDIYSDYPQGYYADGAYTAAPIPITNGHTRNSEEDESDEDPQEAYYTSLRARFATLSSLLENPPSSDIDLSSSSPIAQRLSLGTKPAWRSVLNTMPTTGILGQLPQESILLGLQMLESRLNQEQLLKKSCLSLWAWGLLAKCRDAGQMVSEDIGILRDLGKKAVSVLRGLRVGGEQASCNAEEQSQSSGPEIATATAKVNETGDELPSPLNDEDLTRLLATLDMIVTVVGEFYGQQDLLCGRIVWGELDMDCG